MLILQMAIAILAASVIDCLTQDAQLDLFKDANGEIDYEAIERHNRFWDSMI